MFTITYSSLYGLNSSWWFLIWTNIVLFGNNYHMIHSFSYSVDLIRDSSKLRCLIASLIIINFLLSVYTIIFKGHSKRHKIICQVDNRTDWTGTSICKSSFLSIIILYQIFLFICTILLHDMIRGVTFDDENIQVVLRERICWTN